MQYVIVELLFQQKQVYVVTSVSMKETAKKKKNNYMWIKGVNVINEGRYI